MNELERVACHEIAILDQMEAHLLHMAYESHTAGEVNAIGRRLLKVRRLRTAWIKAQVRQPNRSNYE